MLNTVQYVPTTVYDLCQQKIKIIFKLPTKNWKHIEQSFNIYNKTTPNLLHKGFENIGLKV